MKDAILLSVFILLNLTLISLVMGRKPYTPAKVTLGLAGCMMVLWNAVVFVGLFIPMNPDIAAIAGLIALVAFLLFALNYPFYMRTRNIFVAWVAVLLGGVGVTLVFVFTERISSQWTTGVLEQISLVIIFNVLLLLYFKSRFTSPRLTRFYFNTLVILLAGGVLLYLSGEDFSPVPDLLVYTNICIMLSFLSLKIYYPPFDHSPGLFSVFIQGRPPRLMFESVIPAGQNKARDTKKKLSNLYHHSNFSLFVDYFWFNILVDETLDNAVEHGGKRKEDDITIQVFEGNKYLDFYVVDRGKGFDPEALPSPLERNRVGLSSGRGIHLMKHIFHIRWNFIGNEVRVRISKKAGMPYSPSNSQIENT